MGKTNALAGVANNLADSFLSGPNISFLRKVIPIKIQHFAINFLNETITPNDLLNETTHAIIMQYKRWLVAELEKLKIPLGEIESATIILTHKSDTAYKSYYTCNTTIKSRGREYTSKRLSSY